MIRLYCSKREKNMQNCLKIVKNDILKSKNSPKIENVLNLEKLVKSRKTSQKLKNSSEIEKFIKNLLVFCCIFLPKATRLPKFDPQRRHGVGQRTPCPIV